MKRVFLKVMPEQAAKVERFSRKRGAGIHVPDGCILNHGFNLIQQKYLLSIFDATHNGFRATQFSRYDRVSRMLTPETFFRLAQIPHVGHLPVGSWLDRQLAVYQLPKMVEVTSALVRDERLLPELKVNYTSSSVKK